MGNAITGYNILDDTSFVVPTSVRNTNGLMSSAAIVPNPSHDEAGLLLILANATDLNIAVYDAAGKMVWTKTLKANAGKQQLPLPATGMSAGVYQVAVKGNDGSLLRTLKWVKD